MYEYKNVCVCAFFLSFFCQTIYANNHQKSITNNMFKEKDIKFKFNFTAESYYFAFGFRLSLTEQTHHICTRCDRKITVIFNFFKKFSIINHYLVPFKVTPLIYNTLMPAFFPIVETLLKCAFCIPRSSCFDFTFISLIIAKQDDCALVPML